MKNAAFAVVFFCSVIVAPAAPPSDESLLKLMSVLKLQTTLDQLVAQLDAGMRQGLQQWAQGKQLSPVQTAEVAQLQSRMSTIIKDDLAFAKVKDVYLQGLRENFTQDEVNGINTFYSSPAGKAMMEKLPVATRKAQDLLQVRIGPMLQKIKTMQQEFIKAQIQGN